MELKETSEQTYFIFLMFKDFLFFSLVRIVNGRLISNWFRKPTFSGRFLNFHSHHPLTHKRGTIMSLTDRVLSLSHPRFHQQNLDYIIRILLDNGYPLDVIFSTIRKRLHARVDPGSQKVPRDNQNENNQPFFVIPYVFAMAKKFSKFFRGIPFMKLAFACYNKLNRFIKVHKDSLSTSSRPNVVYKINCSNCDASYVGQTKRVLSTRISEHRSHIRRNSSQPSVITDHRSHFNHDFDWDNVEILDEEINYKKRLISEMIYIKKQKRGLNLQGDTDLLDPIYNDLLLM